MGTIALIGLVSGIIGIVSFAWWLYDKLQPYQRITWKKTQKYSREIAERTTAQGFSPSLIMGIGRGGAIFGSMLSGTLGHRPLVVIDRQYEWTDKGRVEDMVFSVKIPKEYLQRVLLVAGEAHSGGTMKRYYEYLKGLGAQDIRRAVLFFEEGCPINIEYYGIKSNRKNVRLPWMFAKQYIRADREPTPTTLSPNTNFKIKVYLIRHAETYAGEDIFIGRNDADLTVKGVEQVTRLGQLLCGRKIKCIYSSPAGRAVKTAKILNAFIETEFVAEERLREIDFGIWDGLDRSLVKQRYRELYSMWVENPSSSVPDGGEEPKSVLLRMIGFLEDIAKRYKLSENIEVIAISHKTSIRIISTSLKKGTIDGYRDMPVENCEIVSLVFDGRQWQIIKEDKAIFEASQIYGCLQF